MPARIDDNPGAFLCHDPLGSAVNGDGRVGHRFRPRANSNSVGRLLPEASQVKCL